jgi:hypothetical protein
VVSIMGKYITLLLVGIKSVKGCVDHREDFLLTHNSPQCFVQVLTPD